MRQHVLHFLNVRLDILRVEQFIHNRLQIRLQIPRIIEGAHQVGGDLRLTIGHIHPVQLHLPLLANRLVIDITLGIAPIFVGRIDLGDIVLQLQIRESVVVVIVVAIVVLLENLILGELLVREFQRITVVVILFRRRILVDIRLNGVIVVNLQSRILIHGIADFLLQGSIRQFHQMHQLNGQRQTDLPLDVLLL